MKKKLIAIISVMLIAASLATVTAVATKALKEESIYEQRLRNNGYTKEDRMELEAIKYLSDENVSALIVQKKKELKDWKKVREYYKINESEYEEYITEKKLWQKDVDTMPQYILAEMEEKNWSDSEVRNFINRTNINKIDHKYAWEEIKKGKKLDDVVKEKKADNKVVSELTTEFVYSEMTVEEYEEKLSKISKRSDAEKKKIVKDAEKRRKQTWDRNKKESGITDAEIEYCKKSGITNPMDIYQAKSISKRNNVSLEKVVKAKKKHGDWTKAVAEIINVPYEEHKAQVGKLKESNKERK